MERYIRNPHGITIRCCCATCQHKTPENVRQALRCASEREAAAYLGEAIRRHFDKKRRNVP